MTGKSAEQKKNDWILRLLAVVFAVMLWFYADAEQNPVIGKHFDVPIQYENLAEGYIVENTVHTVRITIRGKEADLSSLRSDDFTAAVDLSDAVAGDSAYKVQVTAPHVVERYSYLPDTVTLTIDQMQTKQVPVHVKTTGTMPAGFTLASTNVAPETVAISGLSQVLAKITEVSTEVIDISNLTQDTTQEVLLQQTQGVTIKGEPRAAVHFIVQEEQSRSSYTANINVQNVPDGMQAALEQQTATVQVSGSAALIGNQRELNKIQLFVDCAGLQPGLHELPVQINYNGALQVVQIEPSAINVTLTADTVITTDPADGNDFDHTNGNANEPQNQNDTIINQEGDTN